MSQQKTMIHGLPISTDNETGAVRAEVEGGVSEVRPDADWTELRTVTTSDTTTPNESVLTAANQIESPFVDLLIRKTAGAWGSLILEMVEVHALAGIANGADMGYLCRQAFKDGSDSLTVTQDRVIKAITATGRITVKVTSLSAGMTVKVFARPA